MAWVNTPSGYVWLGGGTPTSPQPGKDVMAGAKAPTTTTKTAPATGYATAVRPPVAPILGKDAMAGAKASRRPFAKKPARAEVKVADKPFQVTAGTAPLFQTYQPVPVKEAYAGTVTKTTTTPTTTMPKMTITSPYSGLRTGGGTAPPMSRRKAQAGLLGFNPLKKRFKQA